MITLPFAYARCIIQELFGIYCPGCGGTRAFLALLHFDVLQSLRCNPGVIVLAIAFVLILIPKFCKRADTERYHRVRKIIGAILLFIWFSFAVVRNIMLFNGVDMLGDFS